MTLGSSPTTPLLYTELASWFHLLTRPEDYVEEAEIYTRAIRSALPDARTVLELGSGGGNNASHMKKHFELTLVDLSTDMLEISRRLNPEIPHYAGDMRTVRLRKTFDVVFVHDAVMYITTEEDLGKAIQTASVHTRPGGVALFVPDHVQETLRLGTETGGHDSADVAGETGDRSLRYLEWSFDPDPNDTTFITDFAYLLREGDQMQCRYDRHINGIFPRATWLRLFEEAGFNAQVLPFKHSEVEPGETEMILGVKLAV